MQYNDKSILNNLIEAVTTSTNAKQLFEVAKAFNKILPYINIKEHKEDVQRFRSYYDQKENELFANSCYKIFNRDFWRFKLCKF